MYSETARLARRAACVALACLMPVGAGSGRAMERRVRELFAEHEAGALRAGWKRRALKVGGSQRQLLWKGPEGWWRRGVIIAFHGGGGTYSNFASNVPLGRPMVEFGELALREGFALVCPDSTYNGATDEAGRPCGKRWDCLAIGKRENVDLPFIAKIIDEVIPGLRPEGSSEAVFLTGISNGGFMTILAATHFPEKITAFAPVSCGDPYGTRMDMGTHPRLERRHAPGVFRDSGTGKTISTPGAAGQGEYANEKPWPKPPAERLPAFKQFQDRNDGIVDFSLAEKARRMLTKHGYRDAGAFVVEGRERSVWRHFWQSGYNRPMLEFFGEQAG
jgi:poly(3-hydroxybutyrate) depolymerase